MRKSKRHFSKRAVPALVMLCLAIVLFVVGVLCALFIEDFGFQYLTSLSSVCVIVSMIFVVRSVDKESTE